uniref:Uncharacterized protein n=1 Tax=Setaria viridis TaxID=4556 RepID=A0A4U6WAB6_SETVI|nr:hypothetical protein SEVIR_1G134600v2 [Setaria viridis]
MGEEEPRSITSASAKEDLVFQEMYKERTGAKSTKPRGQGYMSDPNRNQLLQERLFQERLEKFKEQEREFQQKVKEQLAKQEAKNEAEKEQLKASIRQKLMQEFQIMLAQNHRKPIVYDEDKLLLSYVEYFVAPFVS